MEIHFRARTQGAVAGPQLCPGRMGGRAQCGGTGGDHRGAKRSDAPAAISAAEDPCGRPRAVLRLREEREHEWLRGHSVRFIGLIARAGRSGGQVLRASPLFLPPTRRYRRLPRQANEHVSSAHDVSVLVASSGCRASRMSRAERNTRQPKPAWNHRLESRRSGCRIGPEERQRLS